MPLGACDVMRRLLWIALLTAPLLRAQYTVTHFAGPSSGPGAVDGIGAAAQFTSPRGAAVDAAGNVYLSERDNHTIRRITPAGVVTTFAGAFHANAYVDGPAASARFEGLGGGLVFDRAGNLYVSEDTRIRRISPDGTVSTFAGSGDFAIRDGPAATAAFRFASSLAIDGAGNLYVADSNTIRRVSPAGVVTTLAGAASTSGTTDGQGTAARFSQSSPGLATDADGNVYAGDGRTIRRMTPEGAVTTIAGSPTQGGEADGTGTAARFTSARAIAMAPDGALRVIAAARIRRVTAGGVVTTLVGAGLSLPAAIAADAAGVLYVADTHELLRVAGDGQLSPMAGQPLLRGHVDGIGSSARFQFPYGVAVAHDGDVYVTDRHRIRRITPDGTVSTFAGSDESGSADGVRTSARFGLLGGIAADGAGMLYVVDIGNNTVRAVSPAAVTTIAGQAGTSGSADGLGAAARFAFSSSATTNVFPGIAVDSGGDVYVADSANHTIRRIAPSGEVTTFAGTARVIGAADGVGAAAQFRMPSGIAIDGAGNLFVVDTGGGAIRRIAPDATVTTLVAFRPGFFELFDAGGAFATPQGISVAADGTLFVTDSYTVRSVTPAGRVTTIAGTVGRIGTTDGPAARALLNFPVGVVVEGRGSVFVTDLQSYAIRKIYPPAPMRRRAASLR